MLATAEAVVELLFRADGKGRGFFVMEGAQALEVASGLFQRDSLTDDIDDINPR
jgi:hypothetical protein